MKFIVCAVFLVAVVNIVLADRNQQEEWKRERNTVRRLLDSIDIYTSQNKLVQRGVRHRLSAAVIQDLSSWRRLQSIERRRVLRSMVQLLQMPLIPSADREMQKQTTQMAFSTLVDAEIFAKTGMASKKTSIIAMPGGPPYEYDGEVPLPYNYLISYFDSLSSIDLHHSSELRVYIRRPAHLMSPRPLLYRIRVHKVLSASLIDVLPIYECTRFLTGNETWTGVDISSLVKQWREDSSINYGLVLKVEHSIQPSEQGELERFSSLPSVYEGVLNEMLLNVSRSMIVYESNDDNWGIWLDLHNTAKNGHHLQDVKCADGAAVLTTCVREPKMLDLQSIGFTNVKFPIGVIDIGRCVGHCASANVTTRHDKLKITHNGEHPACVPTARRPQRVAYVDRNYPKMLKFKSVENFIVTECGCAYSP